MKRASVQIGVLCVGVLLVVEFTAHGVLSPNFAYGSSPSADLEFYRLRRELSKLRRDFQTLKRSETGEAELDIARDRLAADEERLRLRCLELAKENPGTKVESRALYWAAGEWPETDEGKQALEALIEVAETVDLGHLGQAFGVYHASEPESMRPLIPVLLQREKENPDHPYAAKLLTESCLFLKSREGVVDPDQFKRIADIIIERHAMSPEIANFCELLGGSRWSPPWAQDFESHLREILEVNDDRFVRCSAKIALAAVVQESGESRQDEAAELFEEFLAEFDGSVEYHASSIEEEYREKAKRELEFIRAFGFGGQAPETAGLDLNGKQMALTDYHGKVVLVSFWATWCKPCIRAIPKEKELLGRFDEDKFAIVGVNSDTDVEAARDVVKKHQIPWRSFQNGNDGENQVTSGWSIPGYPTLYLLDSNGIIRKRWLDLPPLEELVASVERLIETPAADLEKSARP